MGRVVSESVADIARSVDIRVLLRVQRQACVCAVVRRLQGRAAIAWQALRLTMHQDTRAGRRRYLMRVVCVASDALWQAQLRWQA